MLFVICSKLKAMMSMIKLSGFLTGQYLFCNYQRQEEHLLHSKQNQQQIMQDNFNAMQMHQQAVDAALQAHNMAVQMSTPGMGIV